MLAAITLVLLALVKLVVYARTLLHWGKRKFMLSQDFSRDFHSAHIRPPLSARHQRKRQKNTLASHTLPEKTQDHLGQKYWANWYQYWARCHLVESTGQIVDRKEKKRGDHGRRHQPPNYTKVMTYAG